MFLQNANSKLQGHSLTQIGRPKSEISLVGSHCLFLIRTYNLRIFTRDKKNE